MNYLEIVKVIGREILDSRGNPTVEAEVYLADGTVGRGTAPSGVGSETIMTILREGSIGITLGLAVGMIVAVAAYIWQGSMMLGIVIGTAMLCNMFTAATIGTLVPLVLKKLKIDPAVASAPFISTTSDIVGLLIYAGLAKIILGL